MSSNSTSSPPPIPPPALPPRKSGASLPASPSRTAPSHGASPGESYVTPTGSRFVEGLEGAPPFPSSTSGIDGRAEGQVRTSQTEGRTSLNVQEGRTGLPGLAPALPLRRPSGSIKMPARPLTIPPTPSSSNPATPDRPVQMSSETSGPLEDLIDHPIRGLDPVPDVIVRKPTLEKGAQVDTSRVDREEERAVIDRDWAESAPTVLKSEPPTSHVTTPAPSASAVPPPPPPRVPSQRPPTLEKLSGDQNRLDQPPLGSALPSLPPQVEQWMPPVQWVLLGALVLNLFFRGVLSSAWLVIAVGGYGGLVWLKTQDQWTNNNALRESEEGLEAGPESKAAVAWLNHTLAVLFPLISTDVLTPFMDLLEDAIMEQVPSIITSVRLTSATLGAEPVTLTTLQVMSDDEWFRSISSGHEFRRQTKERADKATTKEQKAAISGTHLGVPNNWDERINDEPREAAADRATAARERRASESSVGTLGTDNEEVRGETAKMRKRDRVLNRVVRREAKAGAQSGLMGGHAGVDGDGLHRLEGGVEDAKAGEMEQDDPNADQYVNFKIGFQYKRSDALAAKGRGLHMVGYFGIGLKGLGRTELPVFIDLQSLRGSVQVRILLSATPPFVRTAIITLPTLPAFEISAKPLSNTAFNAMGVPGVKTFVQRAVSEVCAAFVRPETYAMDIDRLILGRESSLRTHAVGVLQLVIHGAHGLPKADMKGSCDPYVVASFSRFNKPLFSTRSIIDSRDPIWEEPAFLLIAGEAIASGETLRLRVVDSDRFSADDDLGVVELDLADLVDKYTVTGSGTKLVRRTDDLAADRPGMKAQGSLEWSLAFRPMWQMPPDEVQKRTQALRDDREPPYIMPGWMRGLSKLIEGYTLEYGWNEERTRKRKETVAWFTGEKERDEMEVKQAPTEDLRSGVLQFHIHQCTDLELEDNDGTYSHVASKRKSAVMGKPALQDVIDRTPTENKHPPSAYCEVHLNDRLVYRTRTKQVTPMPYFNAVSERFIRDWRLAKLVFVIRDERDREHDPILGLVAIPLRDAFKDRCQFTRWYPVEGGLGWGKLRISLLFKPVDVDLPRGVSGYEVATMRITGVRATEMVRGMEVSIETEGDKAVLRGRDATDIAGQGNELSRSISRSSMATSANTTIAIDSAAEDIEWQIERPIRLAVQYRHSCSVLVSFVSRSKHLKKKKVFGLATVRLDDCPDGTEVERRVAVWGTAVARDAIRASQKFTRLQRGTEAAVWGNPDAETSDRVTPGVGLPTDEDARKRQDETEAMPTIIGFLSLTFTLESGVSTAHEPLCKRDLRFRHVYEAWELARELNRGWDKVSDGKHMRRGLASLLHRGENSEHGDEEVDEGGQDHRAEESGSSDSDDADDGDGVPALPAKRGAKVGADLDDENEVAEHGWWKDKRAHSKALHKRNKGIFQLKIARTGKFVKDKLQEKMYQGGDKARMVRGTEMEVEHEGQSAL